MQSDLGKMPQTPWKAWYNTARWQRLRMLVFKRDRYTCQCGCGLIEGNTSLLVCDHKIPHRGDERLFWDETNLQTLLKSCHDRAKQKAEQVSLHTRGIWH
jgi:5-methylcytosine-specific restriction endonuclease McrA